MPLRVAFLLTSVLSGAAEAGSASSNAGSRGSQGERMGRIVIESVPEGWYTRTKRPLSQVGPRGAILRWGTSRALTKDNRFREKWRLSGVSGPGRGGGESGGTDLPPGGQE